MLSNEKYQIVVIKNTYDIYPYNQQTMRLLAETWGMKLRGYRKYFSYGVLPNDHLDFVSNHIIVCHKGPELKPIMAIKNITAKSCDTFGIEFPICGHLFKGREQEYHNHKKAVEEWVSSHYPKDVAYSMGFTIDPALESEEKKRLLSFNWNLFYFFYSTYNIPNVIHGISKTFRLDEIQHEMGFKMLKFRNEELPYVKTKGYATRSGEDVESYIMVLEDNKFKEDFVKKSEVFRAIWEDRIEFIGESEELRKVA